MELYTTGDRLSTGGWPERLDPGTRFHYLWVKGRFFGRFRPDSPHADDNVLEITPTPGRRGVVGVVIRDGRFLLIRRSAHVVAPRAYCFPGGGIDPGESEPDALIREFQEELRVAARPVRRLWESVTPWEVRLSWWSAQLPDDATLMPNPAEVESVHWVTAAEMAALPDSLPSNFEFLEAIRTGQIDLTSPPTTEPRP